MDKLIDRAIEALKSLPPEDCERIAWEIIERVEDKTEWDAIIATPKAQLWLEKEAAGALKKFKKIEKNLSRTFISIPHDHLLREEPYWNHFDELPQEIKKLAEKNYRLWKESPGHPGADRADPRGDVEGVEHQHAVAGGRFLATRRRRRAESAETG